MEQYNLTSAEEAGRLAQLITELTGGKVLFVLSYKVEDDDGWAAGAITNVPPEQAAKILMASATELMSKDEKDYDVRTLRDN